MLAVSYAKINLFLEVLGKLPDNYHEVNTVLCSIVLFDEIRFVLTKSCDIIIWSNLDDLCGENNLIYKIAKYLQHRFKVSAGAEIRLTKHIPVSAGLGGGSSNAAIAIIFLDRLWQLGLSQKEKEEIAAMFGSDINFFLHGGTALGQNRGERITPQDDILVDNILLVNPGIAISAGLAYGALELPAPGEAKLFDPADLMNTMYNRLEQTVCGLYPDVQALLDELNSFGAKKSMLCGSGSTCLGIFENERDLAICRSHFKEKGFFALETRTISQREYQRCFPS